MATTKSRPGYGRLVLYFLPLYTNACGLPVLRCFLRIWLLSFIHSLSGRFFLPPEMLRFWDARRQPPLTERPRERARFAPLRERARFAPLRERPRFAPLRERLRLPPPKASSFFLAQPQPPRTRLARRFDPPCRPASVLRVKYRPDIVRRRRSLK